MLWFDESKVDKVECVRPDIQPNSGTISSEVYERLIFEREPDAHLIPRNHAPRRLSHVDPLYLRTIFFTDRYAIEFPSSWLPTAVAYIGTVGQHGAVEAVLYFSNPSLSSR